MIKIKNFEKFFQLLDFYKDSLKKQKLFRKFACVEFYWWLNKSAGKIFF